MDAGTIVGVVGAVAGVIGPVVGAVLARKNKREENAIETGKLLLNALEDTIANARHEREASEAFRTQREEERRAAQHECDERIASVANAIREECRRERAEDREEIRKMRDELRQTRDDVDQLRASNDTDRPPPFPHV